MSKCAGKIGHATESAALYCRSKMRDAGRDVSMLRAYQCKCGAWHLGNVAKADEILRCNLRRQRRAQEDARLGKLTPVYLEEQVIAHAWRDDRDLTIHTLASPAKGDA